MKDTLEKYIILIFIIYFTIKICSIKLDPCKSCDKFGMATHKSIFYQDTFRTSIGPIFLPIFNLGLTLGQPDRREKEIGLHEFYIKPNEYLMPHSYTL